MHPRLSLSLARCADRTDAITSVGYVALRGPRERWTNCRLVMLSYRHPIRRYVPPVRLTLAQLADLCDNVLDLDGTKQASYTVIFRGADGSEITTHDIRAITPDNERVPSIIAQLTITATGSEGSVELRLQTAPVTDNGQSTSFYELAVTGASQRWSEGVTQTTLQWLQRRRTPVFRYHFLIGASLALLGVGFLLNALFSGFPPPSQVWSNTIVANLSLVAGLAFAVAAVSFNRRYPRFSVVVRPGVNYFTLGNVATVCGILASIAVIYSAVFNAAHR